MSAETDFYILTSLIATGLLMGIFFDVYHVTKSFWKTGPKINMAADFILWLIITFFVVLGLTCINWGEVRFYVLMAIGLGLLTYYLLFSSRCRKVIAFLIRKALTLLTILRKIFATILAPFIKIINKISAKILASIKKIISIPEKFMFKFKRKLKGPKPFIKKKINKFINKSRIF